MPTNMFGTYIVSHFVRVHCPTALARAPVDLSGLSTFNVRFFVVSKTDSPILTPSMYTRVYVCSHSNTLQLCF
jgi:hypothetical protein